MPTAILTLNLQVILFDFRDFLKSFKISTFTLLKKTATQLRAVCQTFYFFQ